MSIQSTGASKDELKLATSVRRACEMLDVGLDKIYDLMRAGEIKSYLDGGTRKVDIASIHAYHARKLDTAGEFRPRTPQGAR
jgi:excisionase family DNA binding protein